MPLNSLLDAQDFVMGEVSFVPPTTTSKQVQGQSITARPVAITSNPTSRLDRTAPLIVMPPPTKPIDTTITQPPAQPPAEPSTQPSAPSEPPTSSEEMDVTTTTQTEKTSGTVPAVVKPEPSAAPASLISDDNIKYAIAGVGIVAALGIGWYYL